MKIQIFKPQDHKIKALIYGASGAGKTTFAGTAPKPIFASSENGLLSIAEKEVPFVEIKSLKDLLELYQELVGGKHDFETVIIDSISEINEIIKSEIENRTGRVMQLQDWGKLQKQIRDILRKFRDLPMHVIFIAQEKAITDEEKIEKIVPLMNGKAATEIAYFMDIVGYAKVQKDGKHVVFTNTNQRLLTKDRTNKIGDCIDADFSIWIEKVKQLQTGECETISDTDGTPEFNQIWEEFYQLSSAKNPEKFPINNDEFKQNLKVLTLENKFGTANFSKLTEKQIEEAMSLIQGKIDEMSGEVRTVSSNNFSLKK